MNLETSKAAIVTDLLAIQYDMQLVSKKVEAFREGLRQLIENLPDNPAIKRLSSNSFTMSSKDLTQTFVGRTSKGTVRRVVNSVWSPAMHDFKHQYKRIAVIINKVKFEDICNTIDRIINTGGYTSSSVPEKFHPGVIENLRTLWRPAGEVKIAEEEST